MPIYEYVCGSCGARFEKLVRVGADAPPCPDCASIEVKKLISQSGFILKGGGWYKDHYGLKSGGSSDKKSGGDSGSSGPSGSSSGGSSSSSSSSSGGGSTAAAH